MDSEKKEISKKQQQELNDLLEQDKLADFFIEVKKYIIYDKETFYRLRKEYDYNKGGIDLADLKGKLKLFVSRMDELPETAEPNKNVLTKVSEKVMSPVTTFILGVLSVLIGLWGELIPPEVYEMLKNVLGEYYMHAWVGTGALLIGISLFLTLRKKDKKKEYRKKQQELEQNQRKVFIEKLEKRYQNRIDQKMDSRLSLALDFEEVDEKTKEDNTLFFENIRTIKEEQEKLADLAQQFPFMLILGKPGSGKSSRLLDLATGLLKKAKNDEQAAIPAIFNLAAWKENHEDFGEWLAKMLVDFYSYPKELANAAIEENKVIPLLDGFDEVGAHLDSIENRNQLRNQCLSSITRYQNQKFSPKQFVICSCIDEYKQAGGDAPVDIKIIVKDVAPDKVTETLKKAKENSSGEYVNANVNAADTLLVLIDKYPELKTVLQTPFYFNAAIQTFTDKRDDKNLTLSHDEDEIKERIVEEFIERKVSNKNVGKKTKQKNKYGIAKTTNYLNRLAQWLKMQQNVSFELSHFQPQNLDKPKRYGLVFNLVFGLFFGLVFGLVGGLVFGLVENMFNVLAGGLGGGLFVSFFYSWQIKDKCKNRTISTKEIRIWNWFQLAKFSNTINILRYVLFSLLNGLSLSLLFCLTFGLAFGIIGGIVGDVHIDGFLDGLSLGSVFGLLVIPFVLIVSLINGLVGGLEKNASEIEYFTTVEKPYRRLSGNIKREAITYALILMFTGFMLIYFFLQLELFGSILLALGAGVIGVFVSILWSPLFEHFILAFLLNREGKAPVRMDKFYDYCAELRILEKEGGSWRFRHQIIHDYFIAQAEKEDLQIATNDKNE